MILEKEVIDLIATILALMIALVGREYIKALLIYRVDKNMGLDLPSLNPIKYIDLIGTILLPTLLYLMGTSFMVGFGKTFNINEKYTRERYGIRGIFILLFTPIIFNFFIAILASIILKSINIDETNIYDILIFLFLTKTLIVNVAIGVFNLLPLPPLDMGRIIIYFLDYKKKYIILKKMILVERYFFLFFLVIILTPLSAILIYPTIFIVKILL